VRELLLSAADALPVASEGLRLLFRGLSLLAGAGQGHDSAVNAALEHVRKYAAAAATSLSPLTAFGGATPNEPSILPATVPPGEPAAGHVIWFDLPRRARHQDPPEPGAFIPTAVPSDRRGASRRGVDVGDAARAPADTGGFVLRDEDLDALLDAMRFASPRPDRLICRAETSNATMELSVMPEAGGRFTVTARIVATAGQLARVGGATIGLEVNGQHFLAVLDSDGSLTFPHVPAGDWKLCRLQQRRIYPSGGRSVALPLPSPPAELAAAGRPGSTAILRATLPDSQADLILHREGVADYLLEVVLRFVPERLLVIAVRYGTSGGGEELVLIPVRRDALARLAGYAPRSPWQASAPAPPDQVQVWDASTVAHSVHAAVNNATRDAWREIGSVVPNAQWVIDEELDRPQ
jgi:hypothetical protein